jgi:hypothetical protein
MAETTRRSALVAGSAAAAAATLLGSQAIAQQRQSGAGAQERETAEGAQLTTNPADKLRIRAAASTRKWYALTFPTVQAAVNYANLPPAQGAGEFIVSDRANDASGYDVGIYL